MKPIEFLDQLDDSKIVEAIAAAEHRTSGEVRVYVSHRVRPDVLTAAKIRFDRLGMTKTRHRNAVLIYFAPLSHHFAIVGDEGVHKKCGDAFWRQTAVVMSELLKQGKFTEAVVAGVGKVGELLASHFPEEPNDRNELPNEIVRGE